MEIRIPDEVRPLLEARAITEEIVREVINYGETSGQKFFHPASGRFISYKRIGEACYYVLYSSEGSQFTVHSAYWHKSEIR